LRYRLGRGARVAACILAASACVASIACNMLPLRRPDSGPPRNPNEASQEQAVMKVGSGVLTGDRVTSCALLGVELSATVEESDELDGHFIAAVLDVSNAGSEPGETFQSFDVRDSAGRLFSMADRIIFPAYATVQQNGEGARPDLVADSTVIQPGESKEVLAIFKVGEDSRGLSLARAPKPAEGCPA